jgi:predicted GNAT superfamily acetyltransferase
MMGQRPVGYEHSAPHLITVATSEDVPDILELQAQNQIARGGALSIEFPASWFQKVIEDMPIVIGRRDGLLVGFLVSSSQEATRHQALAQAKYKAYPASSDAYNSGPLCIAASARGRGLVGKLFAKQRSLLAHREGVAFIRSDNAASRAVHARYGFREVGTFSHAQVGYVVVSYRRETERLPEGL